MKTIMKVLGSKTIWTVFIIVVMAVTPEFRDHLDPTLYNAIMAGFGALAMYFRVQQSTDMKK